MTPCGVATSSIDSLRVTFGSGMAQARTRRRRGKSLVNGVAPRSPGPHLHLPTTMVHLIVLDGRWGVCVDVCRRSPRADLLSVTWLASLAFPVVVLAAGRSLLVRTACWSRWPLTACAGRLLTELVAHCLCWPLAGLAGHSLLVLAACWLSWPLALLTGRWYSRPAIHHNGQIITTVRCSLTGPVRQH